jgi:hypothetical protein
MTRLDKPLKEVLVLTIQEQRRVYDWLDENYNQLRVKSLTILGGGLGALVFLYSSGNLFIPKSTADKIFYFSGLTMVIFAIGLLIASLRPQEWEFPTEKKDIACLEQFETEFEHLVYTRDRYQVCYDVNIAAYDYKQKLYNLSLYPLIFGTIILVVLKLFNQGG